MQTSATTLENSMEFSEKIKTGPGWYGSVDFMLNCKLKGHWFDSQSEYVPGLQTRSPVGVFERQPHIDVSLPLFLHPFLSLKINK